MLLCVIDIRGQLASGADLDAKCVHAPLVSDYGVIDIVS